jgi:putative FmdB family regulatory protein
MPIYEYKCIGCDTKVTLIKSADDRDKDLPACKSCNSGIKRVYSSIGVAFNGSGFYSTDK